MRSQAKHGRSSPASTCLQRGAEIPGKGDAREPTAKCPLPALGVPREIAACKAQPPALAEGNMKLIVKDCLTSLCGGKKFAGGGQRCSPVLNSPPRRNASPF